MLSIIFTCRLLVDKDIEIKSLSKYKYGKLITNFINKYIKA